MTDRLDHDALRELVPLYAAGVLGGPDAATVRAHLATCDECAAEFRAYRPLEPALAQSVPQRDPPASLRDAVLASARRDRAKRAGGSRVPTLGWLAAAALLVVSAGLGIYVRDLQRRIDRLEGQLSEALVRLDESQQRATVALRAAADARAPLAVLTAPDVRQINLAGQKAAPRASARAFWSRSRGVVFTAANLPVLPPGRIYQLWFIAGKTPVSAGLLAQPDAQGSLTSTVATPIDLPTPDALAVSIEPAGGSPNPGPTGDIYLIGSAH